MNTMQRCSVCGAEIIEGEESCSGCGTFFTGIESLIAQANMSEVVYLKEGEYTLPRNLLIDKAINLVGAGSDKTIIRSSIAGCVLLLDGDFSWIIKDITFEYAGEKPADVVIVNGDSIEITGCIFRGAVSSLRTDQDHIGGNGLRITGKTKAIIRGCEASHNRGRGAQIDEQAYGFFEHNQFLENESTGLAFAGEATGVARCNNSRGNGGGGVGVFDKANPFLELNECSNNKVGIGFKNQASGTAIRNSCFENEYHGVQVSNESNPFLGDNACVRNSDSGIAYFGKANGTALRNTCRENGTNGIRVSDQACPALLENRLLGNHESGIALSGLTSATIRSNSCKSNREYGIAVFGRKAKPTIDENEFADNKRGDIYRE